MRPDVPGYQLDRLLGRGATGEVWRAWPVGGATGPVAVKRLAEGAGAGALASLRAEAATLGSLAHPHLLRVLEVVDDPPGVALVLPFVGGGSLRGLLDELGTVSPGELLALLGPIADAVVALHERGLVHGDLKPENVLLDLTGRPVLADAGVARLVGATSRGSAIPGTAAYLDPAVVAGAPAGRRSEVFALGVLAYEALTSRRPHRGEPAEVVAAAAAGAHRDLATWPSVPRGVAAVVEAALDPDPARRPRDAVALVEALRAVVDEASVRLPGPCQVEPDGADAGRPGATTLGFGPAPPSPDEPAAGRSRLGAGARRRLLVLGVAAVAVVVVVALGSGAVGVTGARHPAGDPVAGRPCPGPARPPGPGRLVRVDVDGDGCVEPARWHRGVLRVATPSGPAAFAVGRPGDRLLTGDWDGSGSPTVAVYRPTVGEVLYVDRFPAQVGDARPATRVEQVPRAGRAVVEARPGGGQRVRVVPPVAPR